MTLNVPAPKIIQLHSGFMVPGRIGPKGKLVGPNMSLTFMNPPQANFPGGLDGKTGQFGVGGGSVVGARVVGGVVVVGRVVGLIVGPGVTVATVVGLVVGGEVVGSGDVVATVVGLVVGMGVVGYGVVVDTVVGLVVGGGVVGQTIVYSILNPLRLGPCFGPAKKYSLVLPVVVMGEGLARSQMV